MPAACWNSTGSPPAACSADTDSTITRNRPFFLLRSTNPVFSPGIGYFRREDRARTAGLSDVKLVNDEYAAYLGWNPAGGPRSDFQFLRTHTFDGDRAYQDVTKDFGSLDSNYAYQNLGAYYRGSYLNTDDQLRRSETRQVTHSGRVNYSSANFRRRLLWNATYNINHQDLRTLASGNGGEVALPLIAFAGLSAVSDMPATAKLSQNALLIDGNLTAGAGVDLGLPAPAEDAQSRNIGLDFLNPTEVNRLLVWVDRDLPVEVANSFSWDIYSSSDNVIWRREERRAGGALRPVREPFPDRLSRRHGAVHQGGHQAPVRRGAGLVALPGHPRDGDAGVPQAAGRRDRQQADADHPPGQYRREAAASRRAVAVLRGVSTCTTVRTRPARVPTPCRTACR